MQKLKLKAFIIIALLTCRMSNAQNTQHFGLFPTIDHSGTLSNKFDYSLYYFGEFNLINSTNEKPNFFVFYSEQALTYKVNPHLSFTGSYVYERQHPTENNYRNENRIYLQATYKYNLNRTTLKHRIRLDERFIQDRLANKSPLTSRVRYLFGISTPLQKQSDKIYLSAYNEFFFNTFKSANAIYAENWAYAGVGYNFTKSNTLEVGILHTFWVGNQTDLTKFFYLQLSWISHIDWRKKQTK